MSGTSNLRSVGAETILAPFFALAAISGLERPATIELPHPSNISRDPGPPDNAPL